MRESLTRILSVAMLVVGTTAFLASRSRPCTLRSAVAPSASVAVFLVAEEEKYEERSDTRWSSSNNTAQLLRRQRTVKDPWRADDYVETPSTPPFSPEDIIHITEQIQARSLALQESHDVDRAEVIRTHLLSNYNVILPDKNRQWFRAGKNRYVFNATTSKALPEVQEGGGGMRFTEPVRTLLQQRTLAGLRTGRGGERNLANALRGDRAGCGERMDIFVRVAAGGAHRRGHRHRTRGWWRKRPRPPRTR